MTYDSKLFLKQFIIGPMANYAYLIGDAESKEVAIVDPAWSADEIMSMAETCGVKIVAALLTHGHYDHANAVNELLARVDVPVYISSHEIDVPDCGENLIKVEDRQMIKIGGLEFECLWTPGHTPGSQCFKYENTLITGDTLFINGCGRCDLGGGDPSKLYDSLTFLKSLPDETLIYCGHEYGGKAVDSIGSQKQTNPYLLCTSREDFLHNRM